MNSPVRVRFAPSPTGSLHLGGARTALYNYLLAKAMGGSFVLRVEDTDLERSTHESMMEQLGDLSWLGLQWDEGPDPVSGEEKGPYGPYRQSQRSKFYNEFAQKLISQGHAYYCFLTDEEQEAMRGEGADAYKVQSPYRDLSLEEAKKKIAEGQKASIRFRVPDHTKEYGFEDLIRGPIRFPSDMLVDFVIIRSNGMPVYNFCCVCDDSLMKITHVLRGEEHLPNTLKQMMIYEALGKEPPQFGHLSIILGEDRKKLSKRNQAVSCDDFRRSGYLPSSLINAIALLGWSDPKGEEILSLEHLEKVFTLDRVHASAAVFDPVKLSWINSMHLRALPHDQLWKLIAPYLSSLHPYSDPVWQDQALELLKSEMKTLADAYERFKPLMEMNGFDDDALEALSWDTSVNVLEAWKKSLSDDTHHYERSGLCFLSRDAIKPIIKGIQSSQGVKGKQLFMPLRAAVLGKGHGEELVSAIALVPVDQLKKRVEICLKKASS